MFTPLALRGLEARNRVAISPMSTCSASAEGMAGTWHAVHLGKFALGGAGIVFAEATAVTAAGRVTYGDLGLWCDAQAEALRPIAAFIRDHGALAGIQLAHAGRRGACRRPWDGKGPLDAADAERNEPAWPLWAPSPLAARDGCQTPREMAQAQIADMHEAFAAAAARADRAGFDVLEIHGGHGYLVHAFLSPVSNRREDGYGGNLGNRMRFALELVESVRRRWPREKPLFFRSSVVDGVDTGWSFADTVALAIELKARGVDVIDTSSGGIDGISSNASRIARVPGYHVPYSHRLRDEAGILTQTVGLIRDAMHAESILAAGAADLVAIGREALYDPFWPVHAAQALGCDPEYAAWPKQYGWWLKARADFLDATAPAAQPVRLASGERADKDPS